MSDNSYVSESQRNIDLLLTDYLDLQSPLVDEYRVPMSSLQALRLIHTARPALIHGFSPLKGSLEDWTRGETYSSISGSRPISIAVTDDGLADSVREVDNGTRVFLKPLEETMTMSAFLDGLCRRKSHEVRYLQSQNGNVYRSEGSDHPQLEVFQPFFERDVSWMREATDSSAEAVNLWIGDSRSTTSLHHDPFENIYHVLGGSKTFTLISPIEEQFYPPATLCRSPSGHLNPVIDSPPARSIPWVASVNVPEPIHPLRVAVHEGETLFLPSGWWHRVEQCEGKGAFAAAINYWYPAEIHPERYAYERLARRVARAAGHNGVIPVDDAI
ncbi:MAG: hypothetical protein TREMPRED_002371 [Tremellales sp. Tagirdzhanova-0007]|nr:MAG: hypothetical protein TREMPRED_002371 [Tremellales sp. Tagirdzhanova-0007]